MDSPSIDSRKTCDNCRQNLDEGQLYCAHCGLKVEGMRHHPLAGATVLYVMSFLGAVVLAAVGFVIFGTHPALADLLYAIAAALGPVALIGIIYDQLLKDALRDAALLSFDHVSERVFRKSIAELKEQRVKIEDQTDRMLHISDVGLVAAFRERFPAFPRITTAIRAEECEIYIVGTSFLGLLRPEVHGQRELLEAIKDRIQAPQCQVRFLLTHPAFAHLRQSLEGVQRREGFHIAQEILETVVLLRELGVPYKDVRFVKGTPTVFGIMTSRLMLLNPYPYQRQAYTSVTFLLDSNHGESDPARGLNAVFRAYDDAHFRGVWEGNNVDKLRGYDPVHIQEVFDKSLASMHLEKSNKQIDYSIV